MEMENANLLNSQICFTIRLSIRSKVPFSLVVSFSVRVFPILISKSICFYTLKVLKGDAPHVHITSLPYGGKFPEEQVGSSSVPRGNEAGIQLAPRPFVMRASFKYPAEEDTDSRREVAPGQRAGRVLWSAATDSFL